jgi:hypothetical protein
LASSAYACPACGQANKESSRFCRDCGSTLTASSSVQTQTAASQPAINASRYPSGHQPVPLEKAPQDEKRLRRPPRPAIPGDGQDRWSPVGIIIGTAVAVLGLTVLAGWLVGWPPQLFTSHEADVAASKPATSALPAAHQAPATGSPAAGSSLAGSPAATSAPAVTGMPAPAPSSTGPAAVVREYFAAINAHDYALAWRLGGRVASPSYQAFVAGFQGTAKDTVTIISVEGGQVTAQLEADQADGTVKDFSGVYTIAGGIIIHAQVKQTN